MLGDVRLTYVSINARIEQRTRRVLGVVKEKYGLKDVGQAIDKFVNLYGGDTLGPEVNAELVKDLVKSSENHVKKHGFRTTSTKELRKLSGVE